MISHFTVKHFGLLIFLPSNFTLFECMLLNESAYLLLQQESVMPEAMKGKFLSSEFEKVIDFYICSQSDVFVPSSISGLLYTNVAGMRIASGKNQILVPNEIASPSASASEYMSPYVSQKSHFAYSCFC